MTTKNEKNGAKPIAGLGMSVNMLLGVQGVPLKYRILAILSHLHLANAHGVTSKQLREVLVADDWHGATSKRTMLKALDSLAEDGLVLVRNGDPSSPKYILSPNAVAPLSVRQKGALWHCLRSAGCETGITDGRKLIEYRRGKMSEVTLCLYPDDVANMIESGDFDGSNQKWWVDGHDKLVKAAEGSKRLAADLSAIAQALAGTDIRPADVIRFGSLCGEEVQRDGIKNRVAYSRTVLRQYIETGDGAMAERMQHPAGLARYYLSLVRQGKIVPVPTTLDNLGFWGTTPTASVEQTETVILHDIELDLDDTSSVERDFGPVTRVQEMLEDL